MIANLGGHSKNKILAYFESPTYSQQNMKLKKK